MKIYTLKKTAEVQPRSAHPGSSWLFLCCGSGSVPYPCPYPHSRLYVFHPRRSLFLHHGISLSARIRSVHSWKLPLLTEQIGQSWRAERAKERKKKKKKKRRKALHTSTGAAWLRKQSINRIPLSSQVKPGIITYAGVFGTQMKH